MKDKQHVYVVLTVGDDTILAIYKYRKEADRAAEHYYYMESKVDAYVQQWEVLE